MGHLQASDTAVVAATAAVRRANGSESTRITPRGQIEDPMGRNPRGVQA